MNDTKLESLKDLMAIVDSEHVGLVILDKHYTIRVWNLFMVTHSGKKAETVMGKNLFEAFPELARDWFCEKSQLAIARKASLVTTWEEQPYLFQFHNVRQRAKSAAYMYQNISYIPLTSASGDIDNFAITINDVTDIAASTQQLDAVVSEYTRTNKDKN